MSRRAKPYRPRLAAIPMAAAGRRLIELHFYEALDCLITEPCAAAHINLTKMIRVVDWAMALQRIPDFAPQLEVFRKALDDIFERWKTTGTVLVTPDNVAALHSAAPSIDEAILLMRLDTFRIAQERANAMATAQGISVINK
jgi:hypothetical protein